MPITQHILYRFVRAELPHAAPDQVRLQGLVPRFSAAPASLRSAGGDLGAHNHAFYVERLGLSEAEFQRLRDDAVI